MLSSTSILSSFAVLCLLGQSVVCWPQTLISRRVAVNSFISVPTVLVTTSAGAKCTDIESCREIGERKVEQDIQDNPVTRLGSGARYKVLNPGLKSSVTVEKDDTIGMIFSISTLSGGYMYSRGFGFEKIDIGDGKRISDQGIDSYIVKLGTQNLPIGIEDALIGMKRGERRRIELPPAVGFATSDWKPGPTTARGKAKIASYKRILTGNGSTQPGFPAATIWDVELLTIKGKR